MRKIVCVCMVFASGLSIGYAQAPADTSTWAFSAEGNLYLFQGQSILLPVFRADKNKLHLEARYNYEDLQTFSAWAGYNFTGGQELEYTITPMIGGVVGLSNGIAPGLEFTFDYKKFELYNESEYFVAVDTKENNFLYSWTDLTYSPTENFFFGISAQRTRLYKTNLDLQKGLIIGGGKKNWELTGYLYNLGFDTPFGIITLEMEF
jgi:hypothetical protein